MRRSALSSPDSPRVKAQLEGVAPVYGSWPESAVAVRLLFMVHGPAGYWLLATHSTGQTEAVLGSQ
jgi:hypothetical protein